MKTPRILSIDYDPAVLSSRNAILERAGYAVVPVSNAEEFCDLLRRENFDLALLGSSLSLPEKKTICTEVKQHTPNVWVIACCRGTEVMEAVQ